MANIFSRIRDSFKEASTRQRVAQRLHHSGMSGEINLRQAQQRVVLLIIY